MFGLEKFLNPLKNVVPPIERGLNEPGAEERLAAVQAEKEVTEQQKGVAKRAELQGMADKGEIVVKH